MITHDVPTKMVGVLEDVINDMCEDYNDRTDGDLLADAMATLKA
jgi:uncharacterized protein YeeX (DUF496 family)